MRKSGLLVRPKYRKLTLLPLGIFAMRIFFRTSGIVGLVFLAAGAAQIAPSAAAEKVPFVGCPGDGQQGPVAGKKGPPKSVEIDAAAAHELAWYQGLDSLGVLAPRGWKCRSRSISGEPPGGSRSRNTRRGFSLKRRRASSTA
jgi:hypothetical protein